MGYFDYIGLLHIFRDCDIFLSLMEQLDSQTQGFKRYAESVGVLDDKES